ncbi:S49 family peptidase, partial [Escherichia coli]|nr:S49 family peptidase [Escherichia coli]
MDGNPFAALSDEVRASIQTSVDRLYGEFVSAVASNRDLDEKAVRATQARVYGPEEAYELGLVDGVGGLGSVLAAFTDHLNRPSVGYTPHGDSMSKELIYDQAALDRAQAAGVATGKAESASAIESLQKQLADAANERKALLAAFAEVAGDSPKVAVFV